MDYYSAVFEIDVTKEKEAIIKSSPKKKMSFSS